MKIQLAEGSKQPPNEPVIVVLDGRVMTPGTDYTLEEGELPEFKFKAVRDITYLNGAPYKPSVLTLIPRMTHIKTPTGIAPYINLPVSYNLYWEDERMLAIRAEDNK